MRPRKRGSRFYYRILLSYLVIALVPMVFYVSFIQLRVLRYFEDEMSRFHQQQVSFVRSAVDALYSEVRRVGVRVATLPELAEVAPVTRGGDYTGDQAVATSRLMQELYQRLNETPALHSVYVYFPESGSYVSQYGLLSSRQFHDREWISTYQREGIGVSVLPVREVPGYREEPPEQVLTLVVPNPVFGTTNRGVIALNIRLSAISQLVEPIIASLDGAFLLSRAGKVAYAWGTDGDQSEIEGAVLAMASDRSAGGVRSVSYSGTAGILTWLHSDTSGFEFATLVPIRRLFESAASIRGVMLLLSIGVLGAALLASYALATRIYSPVGDLMERLTVEFDLPARDTRGEIVVITDTLNQMIDEEKRRSTERVERERAQLESRLLALIQFDEPPEDGHNLLEGHTGTCVVGCIDRYTRFVADYSEVERYYLRRLVVNVAVRVVEDRFTCRGLLLPDNKIVLIVSRPSAHAGGADRAQNNTPFSFDPALLRAVQTELAHAGALSAGFGIGPTFDGPRGVRTSFAGACEALRYKFLRGDGAVVAYREIPGVGCRAVYHAPTDMEIHVINRLAAGGRTTAADSSRELVDFVKNAKGITYNNARLIVSQVVGAIVRYLDQARLNANQAFAERNIFAELGALETIDETGEWIRELLEHVVRFKEAHDLEGKHAVVRVVDFIRANLTNPSLDINMAAEGVGLPYHQVRSLIKDTFGVNYVDYVNRARIDLATRLLLEHNRSVDEVAAACGYATAQSLNRFFKKYEGVTPGAYRRAQMAR